MSRPTSEESQKVPLCPNSIVQSNRLMHQHLFWIHMRGEDTREPGPQRWRDTLAMATDPSRGSKCESSKHQEGQTWGEHSIVSLSPRSSSRSLHEGGGQSLGLGRGPIC